MNQHWHLLIQVSATWAYAPARMRVPKHQTLEVLFSSEKPKHFSPVNLEMVLRMIRVIGQLKNTTIDSKKPNGFLGCFFENQLLQPLVYFSIRR